MSLQEKYSSRKIILDFAFLLESFIKSELENSNHHDRLSFRNFNRILFGNIELNNKIGFFVLETKDKFGYIFSQNARSQIKDEASFQIIKRIVQNTEFGNYFENQLKTYFQEFNKKYIDFASENLNGLLTEKVENSRIDKSKNEDFFKTPDVYIRAFVNHRQETTRYKAGEGRNYKHTFIYTFQISTNNESLRENETYLRLQNSVTEFESISINNEDDLSFSSIFDGEKHYDGEIDYDNSYLANSILKRQDYWESKSFLKNTELRKYANILDNQVYFVYFVYLLILFCKVEEILSILVENHSDTEKKFESLFQIYQFVLGQDLIKTEHYNVHHKFEINLNKVFKKNKIDIINKVRSKFSINVDNALQNYYINRPCQYNVVSNSEDIANFYLYFKKYLVN